MKIEGVLLSGGASRRMGADKSKIEVSGATLASRIAGELSRHCSHVTVLGRESLPEFGFIPDAEDFAGPLVALSRFVPTADLVFVVSCDLPRFDGRLVPALESWLARADAVMPEEDGKRQPLCALYRADAWSNLHAAVGMGKRSLMAWLEHLDVRTVNSSQIARFGIDRLAFRGANSPEELVALLSHGEIEVGGSEREQSQ
ncbi:molybdenum cofactor guanylyltransferase [soil metagenome]